MTLAEAAGALGTLLPADKRGQVLQLGNITVINDCYNSNPKALAAMVDALAAMPARRRILVAGEMLELGPAAEQLHRDAGRHIAEKWWMPCSVCAGSRKRWWMSRARGWRPGGLCGHARSRPESGWPGRREMATSSC